jgi:hypothetical protein
VGSAPVIGATAWSDIPEFCGGASLKITGGRVPASCTFLNSDGTGDICPADAGTGDGGLDGP